MNQMAKEEKSSAKGADKPGKTGGDKAAKAADKKSAAPLPAGPVGTMNTGVAIIGFILCFVAGAALMWGYDTKRMRSGEAIGADTASGAAWSDADSPIPISSQDPMWGSRTAPVTIVQFSDFQCPFCSKVEVSVQQIKDTYGPDKVRIVWKNEPLPFHPNAKPAAEAAAGVFALKGNDAFWKFHDTAFKNQGALSPDSYEKWAKDAGVDIGKFKAGVAAHTWAKKVEDDHAEAAKVGVNGTPAAFINGVSVSGAQPFDKFKAVIDQELQKANAKIASGTPKDKIYVAMSSENKKNAPAAADDDDAKPDDTTPWKVAVGSSPVRGNPGALVTIVEFSDFQCPYCKRVEPSLKEVLDKYGQKVRLVWKNEPLPFHPRAEPAAELTLEARAEKGEKGFWDAHDALYESQPKLEDADLEAIAAKLQLDVGKVKDAIKTHKYKQWIDADADLGDDVQASGTPHFFINGRRLVGAQPTEKFSAVIDEEMKKAQALLDKGVTPLALYDTLQKDAKGPPPPEKKAVSDAPNAPAKGNLKAKVVIYEFSDYQCPYCKKVEDSVAEVMKNYGDRVKFVWRNFPLEFHADAPLAAEAATEAFKQKGNDGFWKMHDKLYAMQGEKDGIKREALEKYAADQGLDMVKFKAALDNSTHKSEIDADTAAGKAAGVSGTPAFFINGYFINGAQPYSKFRKAIELALAEAK
jgi:protein-disulfide isomerase